MGFRSFLQILKARACLGWPVFAAVMLAAIIGTLLLPNRYTGQAAVVVDSRAPEVLNGALNMPTMQTNGFVATQVEVMGSERVALAAVNALELHRSEELRERWIDATDGEGDFPAWIALSLQKRTTITPSREGNSIKLEYRGADPKQAAQIANALVQAFIDTTSELKAEPQREFKQFFDTRAKQLRTSLEAAQAKLSDYQRRSGILASDERVDIETARLNELSSQVNMLVGAVTETSSREAFANVNRDRMQEVLNNPVVAALSADISRSQARLSELTGRLGEAHPAVIEARAGVAELRRRLNDEAARVTGSVGTNAAINERRLAKLQQALSDQRAKVLRLREQRDEIEVLQRDVANAQRAYELVLTRASETSLESQSRQTSVSWLKKATPPIKRSFPSWPLNLSIGIVVGGALALFVMLIAEIRDRRLRTPEEVFEAVELQILGVLPQRPMTPLRLGRAAPAGG